MTDRPAAGGSEFETAQPSSAAELHFVLLRLAGRASDDVIASLRGMLAEREPSEAAAMIASVVLAQEVPLEDVEAEILLQEITDDALADRLRQQEVLDQTPAVGFMFTPSTSAGPAGPIGGAPTPVDLSGDPADREGQLDEIDGAVLAAAIGMPSPVALWRAWRWPAQTDGVTEPTRVYLLEIAATELDQLPGVTARMQQALAGAGGGDAQVEVFPSHAELPFYHRFARGASALLWVAQAGEPVRVARVFDRADPVTGPTFDPGHLRIDDAGERARILAYLDGGMPILATTERALDLVAPANGAVVPMTFRTDGSWVWTETVAYYLATHQLAPDVELLAHLRQRAYALPELGAVDEHRALAALLKPASDPAGAVQGAQAQAGQTAT